ncbi:signal transduction histidine kinase [Lacibacter cauensis]|uniref:histidine kinase n=1 Tax=Lacibacter cauensis TaxID=510947 RepID=A0A562SCA3_9BACT|nr:HAMP domain-containing sensor histidine kinase [Lacibacter cauensis]TWI78997.1 signal transduction histidine kinase [Lacibacter cauensis]
MNKTLEQKSTRYLMIWLPVVLLLGSLLFFVMLNMHSHHTQEKQLALKQQNVWNAFIAQPAAMTMQIQGEYVIQKNYLLPAQILDEPRDTSLLIEGSSEKLNFKALTKAYHFNNENYQLTTFVSSKEFFHLTIKVFATEAFVFLLLLISIVVINRRSSRLLWRPFHRTLKKTSGYDVVNNPVAQLEQQTGIAEFDQLNAELTSMIAKVNTAYNNQKNFVENASHEMQTPLAIIRSKLDLLINEPSLTEKSASLLGDITEANDRLSQMNKSLLLLAKIDNNQFPEQEKINISALVERILTTYQEHYDDFPSLSKSIVSGIYIMANPALTEILFSNLIKNAVVHNVSQGFIKVCLSDSTFSIENSGDAITEKPEMLFERFRKGNKESKTTGLGLSLVRQIAQLYKMGLQYNYKNGVHYVLIDFGRM